MPAYQTFPGDPGDSNSMAKLASLPMPDLCGKSFLDIGCNEGFFCGYAAFEGAKTVVGVDNNADFIRLARERFPFCAFEQADWQEYLASTEKKFDVILCASAIHYASDQEALIRAMVDHLSPNGLLVLEIGIASPDIPQVSETSRDGWLMCDRGIDKRLFPTWAGLEKMLEPHAYKYLMESARQKGDPVPRHVFHVRRLRPYALLLMDAPGSGKTTAAKKLFPKLATVSGDTIWGRAINMEAQYPKLHALALTINNNWGKLNLLAEKMFDDDTWEEFADLTARDGGMTNFVFEGYIPPVGQERFMARLERHGYLPIRANLPKMEETPADMLRNTRKETRKYGMFLAASSRKFPKRHSRTG